MSFVKNLTLSVLLILGSIFLNTLAHAEDFLDTPDNETHSLVLSTGKELGFFFNVTLFYSEDLLPKSEVLQGSKTPSEAAVANKLSMLEPKIVIADNTSECEIYQVYYTTDEAIVNGTNVTYAYLIKTDSSKNESGCHVKVYQSDFTVQKESGVQASDTIDPNLIREIFYMTAPGE